MDFDRLLRESGLAGIDPAKPFHYRRRPEPGLSLDRRGVPCVPHRFLRTADDWEAMQAAVWSQGFETVAEEAGVSFSRLVKALGQQSPWRVRRFW